MLKKSLSSIVFCGSMLFFSGCAEVGYNQQNVGEISVMRTGTVVSARSVIISDDGGGALLGGIIGGIAGSAFGKAEGKTAATVSGAVLGAAAGSELNKDPGQELIITLDNGEQIKTVMRVDSRNPAMFRTNDRVIVELLNGRVRSIRFR